MNPCSPRLAHRSARSAGRRMAARLGAGVALACAAGTATGTWSIIIIDIRTGEVALGSATCLTNFDLQANTPVLLVGIGGATAQSSVDQNATNRTLIRDQLYLGTDPAQILALLAAKEGNTHQSRQYGIGDVRGRAATFSGANASAWAGGTVGQIGDLVYAVQGNILVGPDVVGKAVEEIRKPGGDVPDKLMRAMEKAAEFGGDGRCTTFGKSSHIAYMLIARAGDRDASNGNYLLAGAAQAITIADLNGDGMPEIVTSATGVLSALRNITMPGRAPMFAPQVPTSTLGVSFREISGGDFNKDGKTDIVGTDNGNDRVQVLMGNGTLTPAAPVTFPTGDGPAGLVVADLNGDTFPDLATANINADSVSVLLNNGSGGFALPVNYAAGDGVTNIQAGDVDGDGDIDLATTSQTVRGLMVFRNDGAGALVAEANVPYTTTPLGVAVANVDGDGKAEVVVALNTDTNLRVRRLTDTGWVETAYPAGVQVGQVVVGDMDQDGIADLVTRATNLQRIAVIKGLPGGGFGTPATYPTGFNTTKLALADLSNDGFPDVALSVSGSSVAMAMFNNGGAFAGVPGLGGGDYFLGLNVPNAKATDPDPVLTLRSMFNAWRTALTGVTDAVQSSAVLDHPHVDPDGQTAATLTITLRDYAGQPVSVPLAEVSVTHSGGSLSTPGSLTSNPDGTFSLPIAPGAVCGLDRYRVSVNASPRPIVLMPETPLVISTLADVNLDGAVNQSDSDGFIDGFRIGDPAADFNGDGFVDGIDYDTFMNLYERGC